MLRLRQCIISNSSSLEQKRVSAASGMPVLHTIQEASSIRYLRSEIARTSGSGVIELVKAEPGIG